ncbi:hypothetical protein CPELA_02250 [Corynebacterium pelargi]|uniref:Uncharacterized protein n=1 Tax=Corynebacterium pelargi TaxID=1471400 RepID=A0A410W706_9CORY|nr:hypothetical protein CPELA_02250 [Corynebacterium pelargi]
MAIDASLTCHRCPRYHPSFFLELLLVISWVSGWQVFLLPYLVSKPLNMPTHDRSGGNR